MEYISVWLDLLKDVGFPTVMTIYLLFHFEKKIGRLIDVVEDLKNEIDKD